MTGGQTGGEPLAIAEHCLEGPRDPGDARRALHVLTGERGWPNHHSPETEHTFVASPCGLVHVGYLPDHFWPWKLDVTDAPFQLPRWRAEFSPQTPPLVVAAILDTVARTLESAPDRLTGTTRDVAEAASVLARAGWRTKHTGIRTTVTSPKPRAGLAGLSVQRHPEPWQGDELDRYEDTITFWCGADNSPARWTADFTRDTPTHLVAAATRVLVHPVAPLPAITRTSSPRMAAARRRPSHADPAHRPPEPATSRHDALPRTHTHRPAR
ncbi:hypothetical protein GCM10009759_17600 [Kitasatospora saccharophila]|uniref:DUF317 domain-containing protein n=1 Tax=Kitasatospora saccharophila TaxID=407973 RepID=A0ABN2WJI2_9ACTN